MGTIKEALRGGLSCNENGYLDSYQDNIFKGYMPDRFRDMFIHGSGSELRSKAEAVHSSSMLAYNFFHWVSEDNPINIDGTVYNKVFFEVKMRVLKGTNPANMDILLIGEKGVDGKTPLLFIESKFLEYLRSEEYDLKDSYKDSKKWYVESINWTKFIDSVRERIGNKATENGKDKKHSEYRGGIKQGVSHLFALTNLSNKTALKYFKEENKLHEVLKGVESIDDANVSFINLIYEPSRVEFEAEHKKFSSYKTLYEEFIRIAEDNFLIKIKPTFMTYSELWQMAQSQIVEVNKGHLHQYLNDRYMRFAEMK